MSSKKHRKKMKQQYHKKQMLDKINKAFFISQNSLKLLSDRLSTILTTSAEALNAGLLLSRAMSASEYKSNPRQQSIIFPVYQSTSKNEYRTNQIRNRKSFQIRRR